MWGFPMNDFFNVDNKFFSAMGKVADMLMLNIVFLMTVWLGIGPACTALYYATMKNIRKSRGYTIRVFFHSFRQNFRQGFICGVIQIAVAFMLLWCYQTAMAMDPNSTFGQVYYAGVWVILFLFVYLSIFLYPILSRFTLGVGTLLKMAFTLSLRNFFVTLALLILLIAGALGIYLIPPLVFAVPALYSLLSTFLIERVFRKYMPKPSEEEESTVDAWWLED